MNKQHILQRNMMEEAGELYFSRGQKGLHQEDSQRL